jgi:hypothetical protein
MTATTPGPPPGWPTLDTYDPDAPPAPKPVLPPGMVWALTSDGSVVPGYAMQPEPDKQAAHVPAVAEPDKWPKRMLAGGAATSTVLGVVGHYGPGLTQAGHAAEMAGIGVAAAAAGVGALVMLVKGSLGRQAGQHVNVHVNVTATGGNARAHSRSRSRG